MLYEVITRYDAVLLDSLLGLVRKRFDLAAGGATGDDHYIGDGGDTPDIEAEYVDGFEVFEGLDDKCAKFFRGHVLAYVKFMFVDEFDDRCG